MRPVRALGQANAAPMRAAIATECLGFGAFFGRFGVGGLGFGLGFALAQISTQRFGLAGFARLIGTRGALTMRAAGLVVVC